MPKYLFLDVDGVLHTLSSKELKDGRQADNLFKPSCMVRLQRVIAETGALIILSSSWRSFESMRNTLATALADFQLNVSDYTTVRDIRGGRASQILAYIQQHACSSWAVVDDEELIESQPGEELSLMMQVFQSRFVRTKDETGMTNQDADQLIKILNDDECG